MKRASYREGVEIIALNDEVAELDEEVVTGLASVMLLAELFGVEQARVARDVVRFRKRQNAPKFIGTYPCFGCPKKVRVYEQLPECVLCVTCQVDIQRQESNAESAHEDQGG